MAHKLIVMPDDAIEPILAAIGGAAKSLRIEMFSLSDRSVLSALLKGHKRKAKIRILLNPARHSGEIQNRGARTVFLDAGIDALDTNPAFTVAHEKSMVVDDATALIRSLNWDPENFAETREFAVISNHLDEVTEVTECADWSRQPFQPRRPCNLIWRPVTVRGRIAQFIDEPNTPCSCRTKVTRAPSWWSTWCGPGVGDLRIMNDVGIGIHLMKGLKLHAKVLLADKARAVLGPINLTTEVLMSAANSPST
jgi:phosphatidylserine/phosphatidylglycerophosphate/cardiolipin synthase-like enzyme